MRTVTKEDIQMKKQMCENMENMDKEHLKHIENLTKNVEQLTESISQGFGLFRQVLVQPCAGPPQHLYSNTNNRQNIFNSPQILQLHHQRITLKKQAGTNFHFLMFS